MMRIVRAGRAVIRKWLGAAKGRTCVTTDHWRTAQQYLNECSKGRWRPTEQVTALADILAAAERRGYERAHDESAEVGERVESRRSP